MHPSIENPWRTLLLLVVTLSVDVARGFAADDAKPAAEKPAPETSVPENVSEAFAKADRNRDQKLTLHEFLVDRGPVEAARRDLVLFDQDGDNALNLAEFWSVPPAVQAEVRGPLPDPMQFRNRSRVGDEPWCRLVVKTCFDGGGEPLEDGSLLEAAGFGDG